MFYFREYGLTPALPNHRATALNFLDGMTVLLAHAGTQINSTDATGVTPLHVAVWYGYPAAAKLLLDKGANVRFVNSDGHSPLVIAHVLRHGRALLRILVHAGADPEEVRRVSVECMFAWPGADGRIDSGAWDLSRRRCRLCIGVAPFICFCLLALV